MYSPVPYFPPRAKCTCYETMFILEATAVENRFQVARSWSRVIRVAWTRPRPTQADSSSKFKMAAGHECSHLLREVLWNWFEILLCRHCLWDGKSFLLLWSESMRKSRDTHDVWLLPSKVTIGRRVKKGHPGRAGHPDVLSTSIRRQTVRLKLRSRRNLSLVGLGYLVLAVAYCGYFSDSDFVC